MLQLSDIDAALIDQPTTAVAPYAAMRPQSSLAPAAPPPPMKTLRRVTHTRIHPASFFPSGFIRGRFDASRRSQ